jgi:hypothetical protein
MKGSKTITFWVVSIKQTDVSEVHTASTIMAMKYHMKSLNNNNKTSI